MCVCVFILNINNKKKQTLQILCISIYKYLRTKYKYLKIIRNQH